MNAEPIILCSIKEQINYNISSSNRNKAYEALSLHHFDDVNCNKKDEHGRLVAKYPEKEIKEVKESFYRIGGGFRRFIEFDLMSDGTQRNHRIV